MEFMEEWRKEAAQGVVESRLWDFWVRTPEFEE